MIMTSNGKNQKPGLPPPITELTYEQDLKLRLMYDQLVKPETQKDDIITLIMALQQQCFVLSNSITNLVEKWPTPPTHMDQPTTKEVGQMFGILFETKG